MAGDKPGLMNRTDKREEPSPVSPSNKMRDLVRARD